jgi:glycosyltransferase involved in cell wall biosynthesis
VRIVSQTRKGKGNALACGFEAATGDVIAMIDADGSTDPAEIPQFVAALLDGADFAKGSRFVTGGGSADITRLRGLGNRALGAIFNIRFRTRYSDLCYGFNVFWRRHVPVLGLDAAAPSPPTADGMLWGDGFEVETLIHIRVAEAGLTVTEVPSYEHSRMHGQSNLNTFADGFRVLRTIMAERHRAPRARFHARAHGSPLPPLARPGRTVRTVEQVLALTTPLMRPSRSALLRSSSQPGRRVTE